MTGAPESTESGRVPAGPLHPEVEWRRWGLAEPLSGILLAQVVASIVALAILASGGYDSTDDFPMWAIALSTLPLQVTMATVAVATASTLGGGVVRDYLVAMRAGDIARGLATGVLTQLVLVPLVTFPVLWIFDIDSERVSESARDLADRADDPLGVALLILVVGVLAPVSEELFFRGLLYGAFRKRANARWLGAVVDTMTPRWNIAVATVVSAAIFAAVHFEPVVLPGLFAAGVVFARSYERSGRLGPAIWAHAGFNATTLFSLLVLD